MALLRREYQKKSRDNARTPVQWDDTPNAGFTTSSKPWMCVNENYKQINSAAQVNDPQSVYHTWRNVLEKRKTFMDVFIYGDFELVDEAHGKVFAYKRVATNGDAALVVCNFSVDEVTWSNRSPSYSQLRCKDAGRREWRTNPPWPMRGSCCTFIGGSH